MYYLLKLLSFLVGLLPNRIRLALGDALGACCWPFVPAKRRNMAVNNAMRALGIDRPQAEHLVRRSGVRFGRMFMEVLCMPRLNKTTIKQKVRFIGEEHLRQALRHERGVVLITAHCGNWEMLGATLGLYGFPIVAVAQKQTNATMDAFINEHRTAVGQHVTYKSGVREMIHLLGKNMIIGLLIDQDAGPQGVFVDFFGRKASAPSGAAALARLKDAPIVPVFITDQPDGTHTAIAHPMLWVEKSADRDADLLQTTQRLYGIVEGHIRQHPQEWFWLHNRWKTAPKA